ncbi:PEP-CTERM sorting domain-containing protein [Puniceicoccus vermicola]|uniref:PEP-CTERM sorting domain-containing protein n=1 Tax=Puniceicoccus vermicola TaxID=388746 RepID=A0A7X1E5H5_9BACT|nr:PEP-CTERM sorting domain-containing protein [Puniceicoccus vermicola]MBC2601612.1 PEP-CTERM sorting domain-containing protein [Puniceicoccus vermicola]
MKTVLVALLFAPLWSWGAIVITIQNDGSDVLATGSGSANTAGLSGFANAIAAPGIDSSLARVFIGSSFASIDRYDLPVGGPTAIGSVGPAYPNSGGGQVFGVLGGSNYLILPSGYSSGDSLSGFSRFTNTSINDLGLSSGNYTWNWGSGANADSLTISVVPEPSAYAALAGLLTLGIAVCRRRVRR